MDSLQALYAYNAWANARVFAVCGGLDQAHLEERAPGTFGSIEDTLKHLVSTEEVYAAMLRDETLAQGEQREAQREAYFAHDVTWFAERAAQLGRAYQDLLAQAGATFYDEPLLVPWFDFRLTKHDGLLQVLSHSAQHRAQVFSVLGERGLEVPNLDYVLFVQSKGAATS